MFPFYYNCLRLQCSVMATISINKRGAGFQGEFLHRTFLDPWVYKIYFACISAVFSVPFNIQLSNVECMMFSLLVDGTQ